MNDQPNSRSKHDPKKSNINLDHPEGNLGLGGDEGCWWPGPGGFPAVLGTACVVCRRRRLPYPGKLAVDPPRRGGLRKGLGRSFGPAYWVGVTQSAAGACELRCTGRKTAKGTGEGC